MEYKELKEYADNTTNMLEEANEEITRLRKMNAELSEQLKDERNDEAETEMYLRKAQLENERLRSVLEYYAQIRADYDPEVARIALRKNK